MSKYSKHLKDKAYRKMTREFNRKSSRGIQKFSEIDSRSTKETFIQWCEECGDPELYDLDGILSIAGSDGLDITDTKVGKASFSNPAAVDYELQQNGYYDDGEVFGAGNYFYHKPKMGYLEWFNKKFNVNL